MSMTEDAIEAALNVGEQIVGIGLLKQSEDSDICHNSIVLEWPSLGVAHFIINNMSVPPLEQCKDPGTCTLGVVWDPQSNGDEVIGYEDDNRDLEPGKKPLFSYARLSEDKKLGDVLMMAVDSSLTRARFRANTE